MPRQKLGELLIESGLLDESRLHIALEDQRKCHRPLGVTLVLLDLVDEAEMLRVLGRQLNVPVARLAPGSVDSALEQLVSYDYAKQHQCLPLYLEGKGAQQDLYVGMSDPTDLAALDDLGFRTGMSVHAVLIGPVALDNAIERQYRHGGYAPGTELGTERDFDFEHGSATHGATELRPQPQRRVDEAPPEPRLARPEPPASRALLRALVQLLIDQRVIDRDELAAKIRELQDSGL